MRKVFDAAVIGSSGFVGSNMVAALKNRKKSVFEIEKNTPIDRTKGRFFKCIYFCAGNPLTFLSRKDPVKCLRQNIADLYPYLAKTEYEKFIYISSILVYPPDNIRYKESAPIDISKTGLYGAHKYMGERYVREFAGTWLIIRPTSFFGNGLKKNLLFDLRHDDPNVYLKKDSWMDYMPIDWFCERLHDLSEMMSNEVINVGSGMPMAVSSIVSFKKLPYIFHEERWQDDRRIDFKKFRDCGLPMLKYEELKKMIKRFVINA